MTLTELQSTAQALVTDGKGILAADETVPTITKRLGVQHIASTPQNRSAYREMLFATPDSDAFISGVIMQDETIHQSASNGLSMTALLAAHRIIPGIKVDGGVSDLAGSPGEAVTEGLNGLRERHGYDRSVVVWKSNRR